MRRARYVCKNTTYASMYVMHTVIILCEMYKICIHMNYYHAKKKVPKNSS